MRDNFVEKSSGAGMASLPIILEFVRTFTSLDHLNEVAANWLASTADLRLHRETKRRPIDLYQENGEPGRLCGLGQNFYSVPWQRIGSCCRCASPRRS